MTSRLLTAAGSRSRAARISRTMLLINDMLPSSHPVFAAVGAPRTARAPQATVAAKGPATQAGRAFAPGERTQRHRSPRKWFRPVEHPRPPPEGGGMNLLHDAPA